MGEEGVDDGRFRSYSPAAIFLLVCFYQMVDRFIGRLKKRESRTAEEKKLGEEIKELLKQASLLSTPSSFAQAAKLQRTAAAKQKELAKIQQENNEKRVSYDSSAKALMFLKIVTYLSLSWWFWGVPVAEVPQQFLQPLGRVLTWKAGDSASEIIKVGIIPWLVLTTRVSKFLCQKLASTFF